mmetsp:Transcript_21687/g.24949  ORF Transcript_21687/g.24949 Transcript_21687/m.24949 type:complete len:147 (+) Transcript_21687:259-699(+)
MKAPMNKISFCNFKSDEVMKKKTIEKCIPDELKESVEAYLKSTKPQSAVIYVKISNGLDKGLYNSLDLETIPKTTITESWKAHLNTLKDTVLSSKTPDFKVLISGPKSSGKNMFTILALNTLLPLTSTPITIVDLDLSTPLFGPLG